MFCLEAPTRDTDAEFRGEVLNSEPDDPGASQIRVRCVIGAVTRAWSPNCWICWNCWVPALAGAAFHGLPQRDSPFGFAMMGRPEDAFPRAPRPTIPTVSRSVLKASSP